MQVNVFFLYFHKLHFCDFKQLVKLRLIRWKLRKIFGTITLLPITYLTVRLKSFGVLNFLETFEKIFNDKVFLETKTT